MAQQHEMILQLQADVEEATQKKNQWKNTAQRCKEKNSQLNQQLIRIRAKHKRVEMET
jgi:hypothetical protein